MTFGKMARALALGGMLVGGAWNANAALAQETRTVRVVGVVRDQPNAIPLPGVPVEGTRRPDVVHTDVDGRYVLELPAGTHEIKISLDGYQPTTLRVEATGAERTITA